ncbi:flagellar biosynthetic protein FliQ [Bacillus sp. FSL E2-8900]|uniref:flagellar biosynthetic protein FliQ n=1 Tax=Bacillus sp. FSL E2-8900 TaxID=2954601 RepID=UPI0030CB5E40
MNITPITEIFQTFFYKGFEIVLPVAGVSLIVVIISVLMAMMQIQEQTLTFLPKMATIILVIIIVGPWMFQEIITLILDLYDKIPTLLRSY